MLSEETLKYEFKYSKQGYRKRDKMYLPGCVYYHKGRNELYSCVAMDVSKNTANSSRYLFYYFDETSWRFKMIARAKTILIGEAKYRFPEKFLAISS